MSYDDYYARKAVLDKAIETNPRDWSDLERVDELFGGVAQLHLALEYRWNNTVRARMDDVFENRKTVEEVLAETELALPALRAALDAFDRFQCALVAA